MYLSASASLTRVARVPMMAASSTSQSNCWVIALLCSTASPGATTAGGGLGERTGGADEGGGGLGEDDGLLGQILGGVQRAARFGHMLDVVQADAEDVL